ncbi:MAG: hypothetical protein V2I46_00220, partial [Bacteroides sp.]|nr:hypothetical protein [Bacteroides sp.]
MKYKIIIYLSILAIIGACKPEVEEFETSSGTADFTRFVSTGDSYASGFADGAIYKAAQENSYANILASKLATVGGSEFRQPVLVSENDRGVGFQPTAQGLFFTSKYVLGYRTDCLGGTSLGPVLADPAASQQELQAELLQPVQGPFNNTGVPGTKIGAVLFPGYASLNPYFGRFAPNQMASMLEATLQVNPTFYALWIGNYDVMGYAISGGEGDVITELGTFNNSLNAILDGLSSSGAAGAVANIPSFKDIPFFTTVPINSLQLTQELADQLNLGYAAYNQGAAQIGVPEINFQAGYNYWVIQDTSFPYNMLGSLRQIRDGEYLLMSVPQDSLKCAYWGSQVPIPGRYTLIAPEVEKISSATNAFNIAISDAVDGRNATLVDINMAFDMLGRTGFTIDGITLTNEFVSGNVFSLDGLHLTGQGNAFVARLFIEKIND